MNYHLPHHFPSGHQRSNHEGDGWEPGGQDSYSTSPLVYPASSSATANQQWAQQTSPTLSSYHASYYQSTTQATNYASSYGTHNSSYGSQQTLPPPHPGPYGRGPSNLGDYHYGRNVYELSPVVSTSGWDATASGTSYNQYSFEPTSPGTESSETRDSSPQSDNGASPRASTSTAKSPKERKWICYRVAKSTSQTCGKTFARKADLQRHEDCVHDKDKKEKISCPVKKCGRKKANGFLRKDHLTEHLRQFHSQDIPKKHRRSVSHAENGEEEEDILQHYAE